MNTLRDYLYDFALDPQRQFESSRWEGDLTKMRELLNL